ncbi:MAG: response regulator [Deltaproteobacteria bacterium]|nr:response regulator [Deltaproteobacteria bacterium]
MVKIDRIDTLDEDLKDDDLLHSQKMESLGNLAGGIAHDMNNILASIMAVASAMDAEMSDSHAYSDDVKDILNACKRGSRLTRTLLSFARRHRMNFINVNLNDIVEEISIILSRTLPKEIKLELDLSKEDLPVSADPDQLNQVIMNICMNAKDAMELSGNIKISTLSMPESFTDASDSLSCKKICRIVISDTGSGIPAHLRKKIFEPFFTTKSKGKGTGLGLSMAYGTIKKHDGDIYIDDGYSGGTSFVIDLPELNNIRPSEFIKSTLEIDNFIKQNTNSGKIMLVDDEDLFRTSAKRILQKLGYKVITFPNGKMACDAFKICKDEIDVVILDMIMPVMGGRETFFKLKEIRDDISILISSGYTEEENIRDIIDNGASGFISKPFDMKSLSEALSKIFSFKNMKK